MRDRISAPCSSEFDSPNRLIARKQLRSLAARAGRTPGVDCQCEADWKPMSVQDVKVSARAHIVHMIICICSAGFIFPHAFMENEDPPKVLPYKDFKADKKK